MPSRSRSRWAVAGLGFALALVAVPIRAANAQGTAADSEAGRLIFYKQRGFRIPVTIPAEGRDLVREVRLWGSDDRGYHWNRLGQTTPERAEFPFRASRDAEYWFALQTVDRAGKIYPADDRPVEPSLRVVVDTAPPTIDLESRGRRGSLASVRWKAQDEHLVGSTFALEYQAQGAGEYDWRSVALSDSDVKLEGTSSDYRLVGTKTWDAETADPIRVRASVKDRAGNLRTVELALGSGLAPLPIPADPDPRNDRRGFEGMGNGNGSLSTIADRGRSTDSGNPVDDPFARLEDGSGDPIRPEPRDENPSDPGGTVAGPAESSPLGSFEAMEPPATGRDGPPSNVAPPPSTSPTAESFLAAAPQFPLLYQLEDVGPAGVSVVQLWVTNDEGRTWYPQAEDLDKQSPYLVDVGGEGTFGLWLAVQGISGLGDRPPRPGDPPQSRVEVDASPPRVQVDPPQIGTGRSAGKLLITWKADDPHMADRPVKLSYRPEGSSEAWSPIAADLENDGRYIWELPPTATARLRIRIEVSDRLNHVGAAETDPILIDRSRPKAHILGLDTKAETTR